MRNTHTFIKTICYSLLSLALFSCDDFADSPYPNIIFEKKATIPDNGRSSAVGFSINGRGYVALGRSGTRTDLLNDCWEYNPTLDTWSSMANFPGISRVKAMAAVVDSKAYVGLGFSNTDVYQNTGYQKDFWEFDPQKNEWTQKKDFPGTSTDACVSFVYKNCVYVGSGYDGYGFNADFWKYDPDNNSWTQLSNFPGKNRSGAVICTNGERVFFGTGFKTDNSNDWWEYFPATDSWLEVKNMPDNGRENAVSLCINNRYFVTTGRHFGGNVSGGHLKSDMLEYDANRNVWYYRGEIPTGKRENAIAFTINGKGYVGFGENDSAILNDFLCFEP